MKLLAFSCKVILIIGSANSSNANSLLKIAGTHTRRAYLVNKTEQVTPNFIGKTESVGIISGASSPEVLVQKVIKKLWRLGAKSLTEISSKRETTFFGCPKNPDKNYKHPKYFTDIK